MLCVCVLPAETGAVLGGDADVVCVCAACRDRCCSWRSRRWLAGTLPDSIGEWMASQTIPMMRVGVFM